MLGLVCFNRLGLGLSEANAGLAWFDKGVVLVVFLEVVVFAMVD